MLGRLFNLFQEATDEVPEQVPELAAAALMYEVVCADHDVAQAELTDMAQLLANLFDLPQERCIEVMQATRAEHETSVGVFTSTRTLNESLDQEQKAQLVLALWKVAYADKQLHELEEATIRKISELLYVPHSRFIRAKHTARDIR